MSHPSAPLRAGIFLSIIAAALTARSQQAARSQRTLVSPQSFNALQWRLIGPFRAGRVVAVAGIPGNATDFYFGAVDGGVWKTSNAGTVWKPLFDSQPVGSIGALAIAPSNSKVIYAGTGESDIRSDLASGAGVYKSIDGGTTWKNIGLRDSRQISRIVVDPTNADIVYVGALGHAYGPSAERGIYKSTDGGVTWQHVLDKGASIGIADMTIATAKSNVLFATTWNAHRPPWTTYAPLQGPGSALYRSTDSGATWSQLIGTGLPSGQWGRAGVTVSPDGLRVYAVIDNQKQSGLYRSDDGGNTWRLINSDPRLTSRGWYFNRIAIDPSHPDVVYIPNVALYRSEDGGKTISIVRGAPGGDDYHELWIDPTDSARMILGTDQGTTISLDYGRTWSSWYNQPTAQFYHVITDNQFPYAVYGAQQDSGSAAVYSRTDHGQITPRDWFLPGASESGYIALNPNSPNIIYLSDTLGGVIRFNRKTSFSQNISPWPTPVLGSEISEHKFRGPWTPVLVFSSDYKTLYLGTQYAMKTLDGGIHWQQISSDLTGAGKPVPSDSYPATIANAQQRGYGVVYTIAPSALNPQQIWAGSDTGLIHLTRNGGAIWNDVTPSALPAWSKISTIEASRFDPAVAYAAVDRHRLDDYTPCIYRTSDYGKTWQRINEGIPSGSYVYVVREDKQNRNLLYAGTEFGIYTSFDSGRHWQPLQLNLPVTSVRDIEVHGDDLVIATHGRAFWILDDITPLRQIAAIEQARSAWLCQPQKTFRIDNDEFPGTPLPPEEPTANNPPQGAVLDYVLKSPAHQVTLTIRDSNGKVVRKFSSTDSVQPMPQLAPIAERWFPEPQRLESTAGMHRFVWDLTWKSSGAPPTDADSVDDDQPAPHGPRVAPGIYQVELAADGQTNTQPLTISMDPRSAATPAVLQQQQETGLRIYTDTIESRQAMAEIQSVQKALDTLRPQLTQNPTLSAGADQLTHAIAQVVDTNPQAAGLQEVNTNLIAALAVAESGDRTIPLQAMQLYRQSRATMTQRVEQWHAVKANQLAQFNRQLQMSNLPQIQIARIEQQVIYQMTR